MNALILAGGFSTRLYPLTEYKPKALIEIKGRPIIGQVVDGILSEKSIKEIVLITNNRYFHEFSQYIKDNHLENRISLMDDGSTSPENRLGALGDVHFALNKLHWNDDLLIVASDTLSSLSIHDFVIAFQEDRQIMNAVYDCHDVEMIKGNLGNPVVEDGVITKFLEKPAIPESTLVSIPYYIYPKEQLLIFDTYLRQGGNADAPGSIISWLIGKVPVRAYSIGDGYYYDVGTHEILEKLQQNS